MRTMAPAAAPIFRSEQQMRILGRLFARRGVELSVSEVAEQAGVAIATASREIERLEAHGILSSRHIGRNRMVTANWDLPWSDALALILAYSVGLPARLAAAVANVKGVDQAMIFGSWAARQAGEIGPAPRDIDLLVVGDVDLEAVRRVLRPLEKDLGIEVNPVVVTAEEWAESDAAFLQELRLRPTFPLDVHGVIRG